MALGIFGNCTYTQWTAVCSNGCLIIIIIVILINYYYYVLSRIFLTVDMVFERTEGFRVKAERKYCSVQRRWFRIRAFYCFQMVPSVF